MIGDADGVETFASRTVIPMACPMTAMLFVTRMAMAYLTSDIDQTSGEDCDGNGEDDPASRL